MPLPTFSFEAISTTAAPGTSALIVGEKFALTTPEDGGIVKIPAWMQLVNATTGMTSRQSATTVQSGYAAHTPRAYSDDGITFGLLVEPSTENLVLTPLDYASWTSLTATLNTVTAPDGTSGPYELEDTDGGSQQRASQTLADTGSGDHTLSAWRLVPAPGPTGAGDAQISHDGGSGVFIDTDTTDADWVYVNGLNDDSPGDLLLIPSTLIADTSEMRVWGVQYEARAYPTSFFDGTKDADVLRATHAAILDRDGFFTVSMTFRPHYTESEAANDHNLLFFDASNRLFFRQSDQVFVFRIDDVDVEVGPVTFSRHQEITITVEHSVRRQRIIVEGATTGDGSDRLDPGEGVRAPTWVYILGSDTGAEEAADLVAFDQDAMSFCDLILCRMLIQMDRDPGARDFYDFMCALSEEAARMFDVCLVMQSAFDIESAIGDQLDIIGSIVGIPRREFSDYDYRIYIRIQTELLLSGIREDAEWTGTVPNILRIVRTFIDTDAGTITYTGAPPYSFQLSLPSALTQEQIELLMSFISTAIYAGVLGFVQFALSADVWGSDAVAVPNVGTWGSASVVVAGASIWDFVITTS